MAGYTQTTALDLDHFGIAITFAEIQNAPEPMAESIQANLAVSQFL